MHTRMQALKSLRRTHKKISNKRAARDSGAVIPGECACAFNGLYTLMDKEIPPRHRSVSQTRPLNWLSVCVCVNVNVCVCGFAHDRRSEIIYGR